MKCKSPDLLGCYVLILSPRRGPTDLGGVFFPAVFPAADRKPLRGCEEASPSDRNRAGSPVRVGLCRAALRPLPPTARSTSSAFSRRTIRQKQLCSPSGVCS